MNQVRNKRPLIYMITNDVSREVCTNIILAAGGCVICSESSEEIDEILNLADGLYLDIGMPTMEKAELMKRALRLASQRGIPVILDPVGVGASGFRRNLVNELLLIGGITCIRGNVGEIGSLCNRRVVYNGAETSRISLTDEELMALSERTGAMILVGGKTDRLVWKDQVVEKPGGGRIFTRLSGGGCLQAAFLATVIASFEDRWEGLKKGVDLFNFAGRIAAKEAGGVGSFPMAFMDTIGET